MATSWLNRLLKKFRPLYRPVRKSIYHGRFIPKVEQLDERVLPAVTATFSAAGALLRVVGDDLDNTVVVSRDAAGTILVNNGAITIQGDLGATVANTRMIMMVGAGGNDNLSLDETNGAMPAASIFGGDGNDVLTGGSGNDFIDGGAGNDMVFMGAGDDTFQWNPGDGSDTVDGQAGFDSIVFNGSDAAEKLAISANGSRVQLTRDVGSVTMDLNGFEEADVNTLGGADSITVNDLSPTDLFQVNLNLASSAGRGDGQDDVIVNGTAGDDAVQIVAFDNGTNIVVGGLSSKVNITGAEGTSDTLTVNALGGNDTVNASLMPANLIGLSLNGGAGNDTITGSLGDDLVNGGAGNDVARMGNGNDTFVWNPGDGSDIIDGGPGSDRLVFNGSDVAENFDVSADGNGVRFTRDVGSVTMEFVRVETIDVNALGGADTITVNDLTATDLTAVNLNLNSSAGSGDGQTDTIIVNATNGDDNVRILPFANGTRVAVLGLFTQVNIAGSDGTTDHLTVNTLGGNDVVDASNLPANLIGLTVNLGDGQAAATTTILGTSTATAAFGQTESLTATVNSKAGTPTGTVTFLDGNRVLGTAPIDASGQATLRVSLGAGSHALTASFTGSGGFVDSTSTASAVTVHRAMTTVALVSSVNPAVTRQAVTFTATIAAVAPGAGTPTGTVTFKNGNVILGTVAVGAGGKATFTTSFAAAGGHPITAVYSGDQNFVPGSRAIIEQVHAPTRKATTTALFASANPVMVRQPVTFTATVRDPARTATPTGTVTFMVGNLAVATVKLDASGQARITGFFPVAGRFTIRAVYGGDGNFASSAQSLTEQVNGW